MQGFLTTDLPILFQAEMPGGRLSSVVHPGAAPLHLDDLLALLPSDARQFLAEAFAAQTRSPQVQIATRMRRPDGLCVPVLIFAALVEGSDGRYLGAIADDSAKVAETERFHLATEAANEVIFLLDFDRNEHWWSAAFTRIFGHEAKSGADPVAEWFALVHPADQDRVGQSHRAARAGGVEVWQEEYRLRKGDGSYAQVIDRARFLRRPDGSVARSISSLTDVTALREVQDLFQETAEAAQDVIYSHDLTAGTLWLNAALQTRHGHDPQGFLHRPAAWADLLHPADRPGFHLVREQALSGTLDFYEIAYRIRAGDGSFHAVIDRARIRRDDSGRALRIAGSIVDVTQQRDEAARLRAVVEVAANAVYEYDVVEGHFHYSDGMEKTFGHAWTGAQPAMTRWQGLLHPDERAQVMADFCAFIAGRERYARLEYRFARGDGRWARVRERMIALRDDSGRAVRVIGGIEDVTAEHEAAERQRQSQKLEAIGKLTGGVAHDFNNLLTIILGSVGLLDEDATLCEDHRALVRSIGFAARRGAELTSGLLSFARQQPLSPRPLDMSDVFAEMASLLKRTLPAFVTLDLVAPSGLWLAEADPAQLSAALLNLAVNAADAMPGGGCLTMQCRNWVIDETAPDSDPDADPEADPEVRAGDFLRIDVTDTGLGMAPEVASRAFDPFFTTKPIGKGSGLGLSMVWGFAKQSGGHARIRSEPGIGTTVSMFLPRSRSTAPIAEPPVPAGLAHGRGEHILVVEDDPMLRRFVVTLTERLGYRVSQAEHGDAAMTILRANPDIGLLFSDVVMPGQMSGKDLAENALREFPGLLILFTSGYSENAIIHNGRLDEGVHFLAKPYQLRDLGEKLRQVFHAAPVRRQACPRDEG